MTLKFSIIKIYLSKKNRIWTHSELQSNLSKNVNVPSEDVALYVVLRPPGAKQTQFSCIFITRRGGWQTPILRNLLQL